MLSDAEEKEKANYYTRCRKKGNSLYGDNIILSLYIQKEEKNGRGQNRIESRKRIIADCGLTPKGVRGLVSVGEVETAAEVRAIAARSTVVKKNSELVRAPTVKSPTLMYGRLR